MKQVLGLHLILKLNPTLLGFGEVQPPGGRRMAAADWINGRGIEAGQRFE